MPTLKLYHPCSGTLNLPANGDCEVLNLKIPLLVMNVRVRNTTTRSASGKLQLNCIYTKRNCSSQEVFHLFLRDDYA